MSSKWRGMKRFSYGALIGFLGILCLFARDMMTSELVRSILAVSGISMFLLGFIIAGSGMLRHWLDTIADFKKKR